MHNATAITIGSANQSPILRVLGCGLTSHFGDSKIPFGKTTRLKPGPWLMKDLKKKVKNLNLLSNQSSLLDSSRFIYFDCVSSTVKNVWQQVNIFGRRIFTYNAFEPATCWSSADSLSYFNWQHWGCDHELSVVHLSVRVSVANFPYFLLLWNRWTEFDKMLFTNFMFFVPFWKERWPPCLLIGWDIFHFSSAIVNWIWRNLTGSKIFTISYVFFGPIKNKNGSSGLW